MKSSDFLTLAALRGSVVEVNGQKIHVREMSVAERAKFLEVVDKTPSLAQAYLVQTCTINEDGTQLFTEADEAAITASSPHVVDKGASAVMRGSGVEGSETPNA